MNHGTRQLPLPFGEQPGYAAADFIAAASNEAARGWLERGQDWTNGRLILWGEPGCGKTHLLRMWAGPRGATVIDGAQLRGLPAEPVADLAIDDVDLAPDETALLHALNAAAEAGKTVLMTARRPPARQEIKLPDLASRLRASLAVEILSPEDELLAALLAHLAAGRQVHLSFQVQNYLLTHLPRTPAALREAVARLDHAALDRQSKITRAMAAEILSDLIVME
jgi:chromosomal replication initiation ATPase DnaA